MNKYLEKVARFSQLKNLLKNPEVTYAAGGGIIGATAGALPKTTYDYDHRGNMRERKLSTFERGINSVSLGGVGAYVGHNIGRSARASEQFKQAYKDARSGKYSSGGGFSYGRGRSVKDIHADLGAPSGFKTKMEAKTHYRRTASKYHPDKHPGKTDWANAEMAKVNKAWDDYAKHPDGFEKLANSYLEKLAGLDFNKIKAISRANPGVTVGMALGGADGLVSTTKKSNESNSKYRLRQVRKTVLGAGTGAVAGKLIQEGYKAVSK